MIAFGSFLKYMLIGVGYNCIYVMQCKIVSPDKYEYMTGRMNDNIFFVNLIIVSIAAFTWPLSALEESVILVKTLIDKFGKDKKQP